jgi:Fe2+ transport system protein FeoA
MRGDDPVNEEGLAQRLQVLGCSSGQRTQIEICELFDANCASLVPRLHVGIARGKAVRIQRSFTNQKLAPQDIAVAAEKRVIQVKKGQFHGVTVPRGLLLVRL